MAIKSSNCMLRCRLLREEEVNFLQRQWIAFLLTFCSSSTFVFVPPRKNRHGCCFRPPLSLAALLRSTNFSTCHWIPDTVYVCRQSNTRWEPWSISVPLIAHFWCCPHVATNAYATCSGVTNVLGGYFYIAKLSYRRDMVAGMSLDVLNLQRKLYLCWLRVDSQ